MTPTQRKLLKLLKLRPEVGMSAGEARKLIVQSLERNGIPKGKLKRLLVSQGYVAELDINYNKRAGKEFRQRLLEEYEFKGVKIGALRVALVRSDELGVLMSDEFKIRELYQALKRNGIATVRWHKAEGRLSIEGHHLRSLDDSPERIALRRYMQKSKTKFGTGSPEYYKHIRQVTRKVGLSYRKKDKHGDKLSEVAINLQCANILAAALKKGNKKLVKIVGLKKGKK